MGAQHTEGRLVVSPYDGFGPLTTIRAGDPKTGTRIASTFEATSPQHIERNEANARRLAACWNACERVPTDMLETIAGLMPATVPYHQLHAQRDALLAALHRLLCAAEAQAITLDERAAARAAIARTEAPQPRPSSAPPDECAHYRSEG